jgi:hypothetical protein
MRGVDVFITAWLSAFIVVGVLFDSLILLAGVGPITPEKLAKLPHPASVVEAWQRWTNVDRLMLAHPPWLFTLSLVNGLC